MKLMTPNPDSIPVVHERIPDWRTYCYNFILTAVFHSYRANPSYNWRLCRCEAALNSHVPPNQKYQLESMQYRSKMIPAPGFGFIFQRVSTLHLLMGVRFFTSLTFSNLSWTLCTLTDCRLSFFSSAISEVRCTGNSNFSMGGKWLRCFMPSLSLEQSVQIRSLGLRSSPTQHVTE
jgi:hypothetical protein